MSWVFKKVSWIFKILSWIFKIVNTHNVYARYTLCCRFIICSFSLEIFGGLGRKGTEKVDKGKKNKYGTNIFVPYKSKSEIPVHLSKPSKTSEVLYRIRNGTEYFVNLIMTITVLLQTTTVTINDKVISIIFLSLKAFAHFTLSEMVNLFRENAGVSW